MSFSGWKPKVGVCEVAQFLKNYLRGFQISMRERVATLNKYSLDLGSISFWENKVKPVE